MPRKKSETPDIEKGTSLSLSETQENQEEKKRFAPPASFFSVDYNEMDRDLSPEQLQEWTSIYASFRSKTPLSGTVMGIDTHRLSITNTKTHTVEQKPIQCLVIMNFRVKIIIPQSEIWYGEESAPPEYVIKSMMGAKIDYVVTNVDRVGECAIASRRMALGYVRNHFFKDRQKNELGKILKCNVLAVGPSRIIAECNGFDLEMGKRDLSYTAIADLRTGYRPGQELNARLLKSDQKNGIIEVSVKAVNPNPFDGADKRHPVGSQRQAVISGTYAGGVFCTLSDNTNILCIYSPGYFEENFYIGDSVRIVITQFDYKNKLVYGRIWSKM